MDKKNKPIPRENKKVILDCSRIDIKYASLPGVILGLQKLLEEIPPEFREGSVFNFDAYPGWGTSYECHYYRPETDEEYAARLAEIEAKKLRDKENAEKSERATYLRLKKKFESENKQ